MNKRCRHWCLAGLIAVAFSVRVVGLGAQSLWRDEVDAIRFASGSLPDLLHRFIEPGQNGPLYYILLRPWLGLAGHTEFALRFFSLVFGVLVVPLVYQLARRLFPRSASLSWLAAILAAISPYLVWYSQEGKMYTLVVVLILSSMDRYLAALEQGGWIRWASYIGVTSIAFYVHLVAALIVPVQILIFFMLGTRTRAARWKSWLLSMAVLTLPYLPLVVWQLPLLMHPAETGLRYVPLHEMFVSLLASYSLGVVQGRAWWTLVPFVGLLLAGVLLWDRSRVRSAEVGILSTWLLLPIAALFVISLSRPLYNARYLIFVLPAYLLLLAAGTMALARRSRLLAAALIGLVLIGNGWNLWLQASIPLKADFRSATRYVVERWSPNDLVLFQIPYGRHSFDYYLQKEATADSPVGKGYRLLLPRVQGGGGERYQWASGLYTNAGMKLEAVQEHMRRLTAGSRVVWLVATEVSLWDERGLVQAWLDEHAERTGEAHLVRVDVFRYEFGQ